MPGQLALLILGAQDILSFFCDGVGLHFSSPGPSYPYRIQESHIPHVSARMATSSLSDEVPPLSLETTVPLT